MKIFVAGATGALGRQLLPKLAERGHEVTGMTRSPSKQDLLRELGGRPVVADALDPESVAQAVAEAEPEVIVHQLTAIPGRARPAPLRPRDSPRPTGCGRRAPTTSSPPPRRRRPPVRGPELRAGHLRPRRRPVKSEDDPLDENPPSQMRTTVAAIRHLERAVTGSRRGRGRRAPLRRVLRPRHLHQPRARGRDGRGDPRAEAAARGRRRRGVVVHPHRGRRRRPPSTRSRAAAAASTTSSTTSRRRSREWLPAAADAVGAPAPRKVPRWLAGCSRARRPPC